MPLSSGTSKESREKNIKTELAAGKDPKQAVAIGYAKQREKHREEGQWRRRNVHQRHLRRYQQTITLGGFLKWKRQLISSQKTCRVKLGLGSF